MATVGFDFGNDTCLIARCGRGGVDVLLNGASKRQNSTCVSLQGKQRFMGDEAAAIAKSNYKNTPLNIKRLLGRKFAEPEIQEEMARTPGVAYKELEDGTVGVEVMYNDEKTLLSMEQCVAMMLAKLVAITLEATGAKPTDTVISIPGWYTDAQRRAMVSACEIAQLNCLRLLHEGTAVALEYGMFKSAKGLFDAEKPQGCMFLDFGHGTFSATVAAFQTGKLSVKAAAHDRNLGGREFDVIIARKISEAFKAKHGGDPWENPKARMKLLAAAEKAKKTLSPAGVSEARIGCECLMDDIDFNLTLTLADFIEASESLLARMVPPIMQALGESGLPPADIATVEIVGGTTRLGFVKERLADILIGAGLPINKAAMNNGLQTTMNADEAVARGTAWQAALLSTRFRVKEFQVLDAVSFPVKLSWEAASGPGAETTAEADDAEDKESSEAADAAEKPGSNSVVLFKKNEATPNAKKVTFKRAANFTVGASYDDSCLGDLPPGTDPSIGTFTVEVPKDLADLASSTGQPPKIRVNVKHNLNGCVSVSSAQLMEEIKETTAEAAPAAAPAAEKGDKGTEGALGAEGKEGDAKEGDKSEEEAAAAAAAQEAKSSEEPPKKKRFRKVELNVAASQVGMSRPRLEAAVEFEQKMAHQDKVIEDTNRAKNDVEAYVYAQRNELDGPLGSDFSTPEEKDAESSALAAAEDWLYYGDGWDAAKQVYVEKLAALKKKGEKASFRCAEHRGRDPCVQTLKASLEKYKAWLVSSDSEAYSHVSAEEKASVREACTAAEAWLYDQLEAQSKLAQNVDPVLTTDLLGQRRRGLVDKCEPVVNKPKPKPPPKEEKAEPAPAAEAPADGAKEGEGKENEGKEGEGAPQPEAKEEGKEDGPTSMEEEPK